MNYFKIDTKHTADCLHLVEAALGSHEIPAHVIHFIRNEDSKSIVIAYEGENRTYATTLVVLFLMQYENCKARGQLRFWAEDELSLPQ